MEKDLLIFWQKSCVYTCTNVKASHWFIDYQCEHYMFLYKPLCYLYTVEPQLHWRHSKNNRPNWPAVTQHSISSQISLFVSKSISLYTRNNNKVMANGYIITLWNLMSSSRVMIFKAVFYTLYTKHQMGSNGRFHWSTRNNRMPW